jgi:cellulose synthase/poly-beta-1,6-N-acetylglucosamine synthase-like glycosyltransferase
LMDAGAHSIRTERAARGEFLEGTAYLMGIRRGIIDDIPLDVAEDSMMPYLVTKRGWKVAYAGDAKVFVKSPDNFTDFVKQRVRTAKAHETLTKYAPDFPRMKTFSNEVMHGWHRALSYPKTPRELLWTLALFPARLYIWARVHYEHKIKRKQYNDAWERVESTKK